MRHITPPDITIILEDAKDDIFASLNCIQIGKINSYDITTQTAEIEIQMKRMLTDNTTVSFPVLVDCPVMTLQGGGAFIEIPISQGDYCIILFNDRDIDTWFSSANVKEPNTNRKHDLSDGIAIVGINPKSNVLSLVGSIVKIYTNDNDFKIDAGNGDIALVNTGNITMQNGTEPFVLGTQLTTQLTTILTALQTFTTGLNVSTLSSQASVCATAMGTALGILENLKSTTIKGK